MLSEKIRVIKRFFMSEKLRKSEIYGVFRTLHKANLIAALAQTHFTSLKQLGLMYVVKCCGL